MYVFHNDPAHAWLAVKSSEIARLGIGDKISQFSYQNGSTVYLEEDSDAGVFLRAKEAAGEKVTKDQIREVYSNHSHRIRNYESYRGISKQLSQSPSGGV